MLHYPTLESLQAYRNYPGLSQSFLKKVLANDLREHSQTIPMIIGSLLDAKLTSPNLVNDLFHRGMVKRPSDSIKGFIDSLYLEIVERQQQTDSPFQEFDEYKNWLIQAARDANYQSRWGDDAIWSAISKEGTDYWNELVQANGKMMVTEEEWQSTELITSMCMSNSVTGKYFLNTKETDIYYQYPLYHKRNPKILLKGLADMIVVEHETKTIYLIDLKFTTSRSINEWVNICRKMNYPFQMSFYAYILEDCMKELNAEGYKILCRWIVIPNSVDYFKPWIVPCPKDLLEIGMYGYKIKKDVSCLGKTISYTPSPYRQGWLDALNVYNNSNSLNINDFNPEWYESHGKMSESQIVSLFFA